MAVAVDAGVDVGSGDVCKPSSVYISSNNDKRIAFFPVRVESQSQSNSDLINANLVYEVNKDGETINFLGLRPEKDMDKPFSKLQRGLKSGDKIYTYAYNGNSLFSKGETMLIEQDPLTIQAIENFGPRYVEYSDSYLIQFEACDYSNHCGKSTKFESATLR